MQALGGEPPRMRRRRRRSRDNCGNRAVASVSRQQRCRPSPILLPHLCVQYMCHLSDPHRVRDGEMPLEVEIIELDA